VDSGGLHQACAYNGSAGIKYACAYAGLSGVALGPFGRMQVSFHIDSPAPFEAIIAVTMTLTSFKSVRAADRVACQQPGPFADDYSRRGEFRTR
jgi:hypothetical protein